jgi:hypothetical protein
MTTAAPVKTEDKTFVVSYRIVSTHQVTVTRPADITEDELIESITSDDIANGEPMMGWDDVKEAWSQETIDGIYDENFELLFDS